MYEWVLNTLLGLNWLTNKKCEGCITRIYLIFVAVAILYRPFELRTLYTNLVSWGVNNNFRAGVSEK